MSLSGARPEEQSKSNITGARNWSRSDGRRVCDWLLHPICELHNSTTFKRWPKWTSRVPPLYVLTSNGCGVSSGGSGYCPMAALAMPAKTNVSMLQIISVYFGAMRIAPSMRMVSPLSILFSMMCCTSAANSGGLPSLCGKGTCWLSDCCAASGSAPSRGV